MYVCMLQCLFLIIPSKAYIIVRIPFPIDNACRDAGYFWLVMDKMAGKWVKRPLLPCLGFSSSYTDLGCILIARLAPGHARLTAKDYL